MGYIEAILSLYQNVAIILPRLFFSETNLIQVEGSAKASVGKKRCRAVGSLWDMATNQLKISQEFDLDEFPCHRLA